MEVRWSDVHAEEDDVDDADDSEEDDEGVAWLLLAKLADPDPDPEQYPPEDSVDAPESKLDPECRWCWLADSGTMGGATRLAWHTFPLLLRWLKPPTWDK